MSEEPKLPPLNVLLDQLKEDAATLDKAAEIIFNNKPLYVELIRREWMARTQREINDTQAERLAILGHAAMVLMVEQMEEAVGMTERGEVETKVVKVEDLHTPTGTKH